MGEENSSFKLKPSIKSLSDLIFGLALSIGALTLIGQQPQTTQGLLVSLLFYGFSFIILIGVWRVYSTIISVLPVETNSLINLNILLLFIVTIEPFLFNQLLTASGDLLNSVNILYCFDLAAMFLILAYFDHALAKEENNLLPKKYLVKYRTDRNFNVLIAGMFLIAIIPVLGSVHVLTFTVNNVEYNLSVRSLLMFSAIPVSWIRNMIEGRQIKPFTHLVKAT